MSLFLARLLEPFARPLVIAGSALAIILGLVAWDALIDDPAVRREARQNYVTLTDLTAVQAELEKERVMRLQAEVARVGFARLLEDAEKKQAAASARLEQEIDAYEAELDAGGRSCRLDDADIEWLRKH